MKRADLADISIQELLDLARAKSGIPNDSQLAGAIGVHKSAMIGYRKGIRVPTDENAVALARLAGLDELVILAKTQSWRSIAAGSEHHAAWERIVNRLSGIAKVSIMIAALMTTTHHVHASTSPATSEGPGSIYIMRQFDVHVAAGLRLLWPPASGSLPVPPVANSRP